MPDASWWDISEIDYHLDTDHITRSMLEVARRSPLEYYLRFVAKTMAAPQPNNEMRIGTLTHCAFLEPDRLGYVAQVDPGDHDPLLVACPHCGVPPGARCMDPKGKQRDFHAKRVSAAPQHWRDRLQPDQMIVTPEDLQRAEGMAAALRADTTLSKYLQAPYRTEATARWVDARTGLPGKVRFDIITELGIIPDIKTMSGYPDTFRQSAIRFGYARQAAYYLMAARELGIPNPRFIFVAIRNEFPHDPILFYEPLPDTLQRAHAQIVAAQDLVAECAATGVWSHPDEGKILPLDLPPWA